MSILHDGGDDEAEDYASISQYSLITSIARSNVISSLSLMLLYAS